MRVFLLLLFVVLLAREMAGNALGLNMSFAPGLSVKNALLYLAFIGIAVDAALKRNRHFEVPSVVVPYALCVAYALFTWLVIVLIIDYPGYSAFGSLLILKSSFADYLIVFLVFFYGLLHVKDAVWLAKGLIWVVILVNLLSVMDALNLPDLGMVHTREDGRIGGPAGESNQYALYLTMFIPCIIALAMLERGWRRGLAIAGAFVSVLAFMLTASRGGMLGLIGGGLIATWLLRQFISLRTVGFWAVVGVLLLSAVSVIMYALGYGDLLYDRFIDQSARLTLHDASSGRTGIWIQLLAKMFDSPHTLITGFGWSSYNVSREFLFAPHSTYLGIFFELGIIGLLLIVATFANTIRIARNALEIADPTVSPLLIAFVFGMSAVLVGILFVELYAPWTFIWAVTGVCMRVSVGLLATSSGASRDSAAAVMPERPITLAGGEARPAS